MELEVRMINGQPIDQERVKRRRVKHEKTFAERLTEEAQKFREAAAAASPGMARELLLKRARKAETALDINEWLKSPGLQPPGA
jgi:hypothetical protein